MTLNFALVTSKVSTLQDFENIITITFLLPQNKPLPTYLGTTNLLNFKMEKFVCIDI